MDIPTQAQPASDASQPSSPADEVARSERLYPDDQPTAEPEAKPSPKRDAAAEPQGSSSEKPDTSDYNLQMPEGVQLDQDLLTSAVPLLREAGVSSEQAEKLIPFVTQVQERYHQANLDELSALTKTWVQEAKADPEIGGKNWKETGRLAGVALKAGGTAEAVREAQELLNESGLGNHPAMIRLFRNMGAAIESLRGKEKEPVAGTWQDENQRHQRAIYPNDPPTDLRPLEERARGSRRAPRSRLETSYPDDQPHH